MKKDENTVSLAHCTVCPRMCGVDRTQGKTGFCGMTDQVRVARAALHMWEEPCISGNFGDNENIPGSGTVFFSGCTMRCVYCQNHSIAAGTYGEEISVQRLADIFLELQEAGAANINLVTPTHFTLQIIKALDLVKDRLQIPVVHNTSGYESVQTLKLLDGYVDIYLTDFKYMDGRLAEKYSKAPDYAEVAKAALDEMVRQTGEPCFAENGMMQKGVIVRHLMLPGQLLDSKKIVRYVHETYGDRVYLSLMNQYTPLPHVSDIPELNCKVKKKSYDKLVDFALSLGITNAFVQEGEAAKESFIPEFDGEGVLQKIVKK